MTYTYGVNDSELWERYAVYDCDHYATVWAELTADENHQCYLLQYHQNGLDFVFYLN